MLAILLKKIKFMCRTIAEICARNLVSVTIYNDNKLKVIFKEKPKTREYTYVHAHESQTRNLPKPIASTSNSEKRYVGYLMSNQ